jgi:hypothetical protein
MHTLRTSGSTSTTSTDRTAVRRAVAAPSTWFLGRPGHLYASRFAPRRRSRLDDRHAA